MEAHDIALDESRLTEEVGRKISRRPKDATIHVRTAHATLGLTDHVEVSIWASDPPDASLEDRLTVLSTNLNRLRDSVEQGLGAVARAGRRADGRGWFGDSAMAGLKPARYRSI
jgi:hypothetical protein